MQGTTSGITSAGAPLNPSDYASGVAGITAEVTSTTKITITSVAEGVSGNSIAIANVAGNAATATSLPTKGRGGATTILRGVLMAPSGVILSLSGNSTSLGNVPVKTNTAVSANGVIIW